MQRGLAILCEVFLAAGARRVLPFVAGLDEVRSMADVSALRTRKLAPSDVEVTAFHPLGTCRIGSDPRTSVLGPEHETHAVERLFVTDGSAVPSSLGVNPQMTIMAMALRAAEGIDARLS
jgi:choline dehydrogenase-like flavoprotein